MKTFVTFGSDHRHEIGEQVFDKDCVAVIESPNAVEGRRKAFDLFGPQFAFEYPESYWQKESIKHFPRGYINVESDSNGESNIS